MSGKKPTTVECPTCKKPVVWNEESPFRPFCSKRCQLIDLGAWANEEHVISNEDSDQELDMDHFDTGNGESFH